MKEPRKPAPPVTKTCLLSQKDKGSYQLQVHIIKLSKESVAFCVPKGHSTIAQQFIVGKYRLSLPHESRKGRMRTR